MTTETSQNAIDKPDMTVQELYLKRINQFKPTIEEEYVATNKHYSEVAEQKAMLLQKGLGDVVNEVKDEDILDKPSKRQTRKKELVNGDSE